MTGFLLVLTLLVDKWHFIGISMVMQVFDRTELISVNMDLRLETQLSIYQSIEVSILTCGDELWSETEKIR